MSQFRNRRKRLLSAAGGRQVVAAKPGNVFYLTDFWGGGVAIVHTDRTVIVTSPLEVDRAKKTGNEVEVMEVKTWADMPAAVLKLLKGAKTLVDDDGSFRGAKGLECRPETFLEARSVKDEVEISRIKKASAAQDRIFSALEREIKAGRSERDVAGEVMKLATARGLTPSGSDSALSPTIIASGPNGALPHGELSGRRMKRGDFVVADIFFRYQGYNSDETRTFAIETATGEMRERYRAVLEAQEAALEMMTEGTRCCDVSEAALQALRRHGMDRFLNHGVGHGVGIDIHELPSISRVNKAPLRANQVVTDEPGIYFPGKYGIRIEDTVVAGRKPVCLTRYSRELLTVG
ncbi:MAG: Xaa-Pro peptidase family protein [Nitrososphaerales archaeon]|nr:Xaa-Pro peptidase family protein [Nitrososphaerales archaeon]